MFNYEVEQFQSDNLPDWFEFFNKKLEEEFKKWYDKWYNDRDTEYIKWKEKLNIPF